MLEALSMTQLLATFFGVYMLAVGIGVLMEREGFIKIVDELHDNTTLGYITGVLVFVLGATLVALHNIWTDPLAIFVSLISWAAFIEGILLLAFRRPFLGLVGKVKLSKTNIPTLGLFGILLGVGLIYGGLS